MRKITKILLFILFILPIKVNALTGNINLNCSPTTVKASNNIICEVTATSDGKINGIRADIVLSNNLEYVDFETNSSWQGDGTGNQIGLYTSENVEGTHNLGILTIKVKDNVFDSDETITLSNCLYSNEAFEKISIKNVSVNVRIPSSNNRLSKLETSPGTIDFDSDTLNYTITTDSPTIKITAEKENAKSKLSGDTGVKNLNYGLNTFKINVTSEDGEKRTYTLNVTRKDNRSSDNKLSSLTISGHKIDFNENTYNYDLSVDYETTNVKINASLKNNKSSFLKGYEPGTKTLEEGLNKIELKIKAENGSINTYTLNITRKEDANNSSDDNYLENIKIENNNLDFKKEQEEYKVTVDKNTNNLDINAISSSNKSKVEIIGNDNFQIGENTVTIKVTSGNGEVREYKIIVTKTDTVKVKSNNTYLKKLQIENYKIDFDKNKFKYNLEIAKEKELSITALPEEENAKVDIIGNEELKNKSIIKIIVTAEDGTKKEYSIKIVKRDYFKIMLIVESITIIGILLYSIIKLLKNKRNNTYEEI